ncbi:MULTISPECIES: alpha/beta hydrolase [unclassified Cytobacillus]|uniref:alpha/beta hydrolase n=1 Tax=unclassified Cytobacillus TaxID=2675268 RepID=UPI00135975D8|nr:alpha/beta fold hydrolase [Cytobacillus sp. AMY 15.2]KAF0817334.1 hypothetical protein KIS4809_3816 [Bacillus sp. ZZV12-4809]MCM3092803.1 alpha/beta fold hydrolase [Cytobacillus sp. AMY 15.2]
MTEHYPVLDGAESFYYEGNEIGILITHGFLGTPQSVRFLGESFAKLGYTVYAPRLKGHGTHYKDIENTTHEDWFAEAEKGYLFLKERCTSVFAAGQSMGGALTLWLANKYPEIAGIALMNAALRVPCYEYLKGKTNPRYLDEGAPDIKKEGVEEITYGKVPIRSIFELQNVMENTPDLLPSIKTPVIGFKSLEDHVVPAECTDFILDNIGSMEKKAVSLYNSYHVASMDHDKEEIVNIIHQYIRQNIASSLSFV